MTVNSPTPFIALTLVTGRGVQHCTFLGPGHTPLVNLLLVVLHFEESTQDPDTPPTEQVFAMQHVIDADPGQKPGTEYPFWLEDWGDC